MRFVAALINTVRCSVKEAQKRVEELQFDSEQDELDFLRKRVLKRIGRLPPVRKREVRFLCDPTCFSPFYDGCHCCSCIESI